MKSSIAVGFMRESKSASQLVESREDVASHTMRIRDTDMNECLERVDSMPDGTDRDFLRKPMQM
jgi:hypothetical protein